MKKINRFLPFVLVAVMLLITACNGNGTGTTTEMEPENEYQPVVTLPAPIEPESEAEPPVADDSQNGEEIAIQPLPEEADEPSDGEINPDLITIDDASIVHEEWPPVIVDGVGVQGSSHRIVGDEVFPNYVSLVIVARALGSQVGIEGNEIVLDGLNGRISFEIGSDSFRVGDAVIVLRQPAEVFDNVLYVPVEFFREVFGAAEAFFGGGEVHINTEPGDMH